MAFSHTIFVFIAPNLVYLQNLDMNKVGSVSGTSVLLHLSHCSSLCDAHIWSYKGSKMGEILLNCICAKGLIIAPTIYIVKPEKI